MTELERRRAHDSKRSAKSTARNKDMRSDRYWREDIAYLYKCSCAVCGFSFHLDMFTEAKHCGGMEIHHIVEVKNGGKASWDNLIALCPNCHKAVHLGLITTEQLQSRLLPAPEGRH